jgi:hypothetical protein
MLDHDSPYDDRTSDLIARVRKMREAAERRMNAFGKIADYDVRRVMCHKTQASPLQSAEAAAVTPQQSAKEEKLATSKKQKTPQAVLEFPLPPVSSDGPEGA